MNSSRKFSFSVTRRIFASVLSLVMLSTTTAAYARPGDEPRMTHNEVRQMRLENRALRQEERANRAIENVGHRAHGQLSVGALRPIELTNPAHANRVQARQARHQAIDSARAVRQARQVHVNRTMQTTEAGRSIGMGRGVSFDLSSNKANITLGNKLFKGTSSVEIEIGGVKKTIAAGAMVTAAEYVAIQQRLEGSEQTIVVDSQGRAQNGSFNLSSVTASGPRIHASSLVIPENVSSTGNFARNSEFKITGQLDNYGSIYTLSNKRDITGGTISAGGINNASGAVITSNTSDPNNVQSVDLTLRARNDINNAGEISSSGSLTLDAGASVNNSGNVKAANSVNIKAPNLNNSGSVKANGGDINLNAPAVLNVNNTNGVLAASNSINVRACDYAGSDDSTISGGDLISTALNLNSGDGTTNVSVKNLTGSVNGTGKAAHVAASTDNLKVGSIAFTGDPTFYNASGDVTLNGDITVGETLSVIASANINSDANIIAGDNNSGYDVNLVAGANIINTTPDVTVDGASATGGNVLLSGGSISTASTATSGDHDAGNLTIIAYADGSGNNGNIDTSAAVALTNAIGNGTNGNITVIGGGSQIHTGVVSPGMVGLAGGNVNIVAAQPTTSDGQTISFAADGNISSGNSFVAGAASNGNVIVDASETNGDININAANGSVTLGYLYSTGNVNVAAGTGVNGNIDIHGNNVSVATSSGNITTNGAAFSINALNDIYLHGDSKLDTTSSSTGGSVSLIAGGDIDLGTMDIDASGIHGGSVFISSGANSDQFVLRMQDINASSFGGIGAGGAVVVQADTNQVFRVGTGGSVRNVDTSGQAGAGDFTFRNSGSGGLEIVGSPLNNDTSDGQGPDVTFETGGNINFAGGTTISSANSSLTNGNGDISISAASMTQTGNLILDASAGASLGTTGNVTILLANNNISTNGNHIDIRSGNDAALNNAAISTAGGNVDLKANNHVSVGEINTAGFLPNSNGGSVFLQTEGGNLSVGNITTDGTGTGNGGSVSVLSNANNNPTTAFGNISANGGDSGAGGNVTISANFSELATSAIQARGGTNGDGGQVSISLGGSGIGGQIAGSIDASAGRNGGSIAISGPSLTFGGGVTLNAASTDTSGAFANGNVNISTDSLMLDGGDLNIQTYNPQALSGTGNITITTPSTIETSGNSITAHASGLVEFTSGTQQLNTGGGGGVHIIGQQGIDLHGIQLNTSANGFSDNGGNVTLHSDNYITGILYINTTGSTNGGNVDIATGNLLNIGYVQADGLSGFGGNVSIHVVDADVSVGITSTGGGNVSITGDNSFNASLLGADLSSHFSDGGSVFVDTNGGSLTVGGAINTSSSISSAGNVDLRTHTFAAGNGTDFQANGAGGHGGDVSILATAASDMTVGFGSGAMRIWAQGQGGVISSDGGNITLTTAGNISVDSASAISVASVHGSDSGNTGNMTFIAGGNFSSAVLLNLFNSSVSGGSGNGGNLTIAANAVNLTGIQTGAGNGNGGNINITSSGAFSNSGVIYTGGGQSGSGGNISISAASSSAMVLDGQIATNSGSFGASSGSVSISNSGDGFGNGGITFTDSINTQSNSGNGGNILISATGSGNSGSIALNGSVATSGANAGNVSLNAGASISAVDIAAVGTASTGGDVSIAAGSNFTANEIHTNGLGSANSGNLTINAGGDVLAFALDTSSANEDAGNMVINANQLAVTAPIPLNAISTEAYNGRAGNLTINLTSANPLLIGDPTSGNGFRRIEFYGSQQGADVSITASSIDFVGGAGHVYVQGPGSSATITATTGDVTMGVSTNLNSENVVVNAPNGAVNLSGLMEGSQSITINSNGAITQHIFGSHVLAPTVTMITNDANIGSDAQAIRTNAANLHVSTSNVSGTASVYVTDYRDNGVSLFGSNLAGYNGGIFFLSATGTNGNINTAPGGTVSGGLTVLHTDTGSIGQMPTIGNWSNALQANNQGTSRTLSAPMGSVYANSLNSTNFVDATIDGVLYSNIAANNFMYNEAAEINDGFFWGGGVITANNVLLQAGNNITQTLAGTGNVPISLVGPDQTLTVRAGGTANILVQSSVTNIISQLGVVNAANPVETYNINTSGELNVLADIVDAGGITLINNSGALTVGAGVYLVSPNSITIQNTDTTGGSISIGANALISATNSGQVNIVIGAVPPSPSVGSTPANVNVITANGGQVYFGDNIITANAPTNTVTADGGVVIFSTDTLPASAINLGGGVIINGGEQTFALTLSSLDLTDTNVVNQVLYLQAQGYVGGTLIVDSGVAIGGNLILDPTDFAGLLTAANIPQNVVASFQDFGNSNPLTINISASSTTPQVLIGGTHEFIGSSPSFGVLNITSDQAGPVLLVTSTGQLTSNGNLNVLADTISNAGLIQADSVVISTQEFSLPGGNVVATTSATISSVGNISGTGVVTSPTVNLSSATGNIGNSFQPLQTVAADMTLSATNGNAYVQNIGSLNLNGATVSNDFVLSTSGNLNSFGPVSANNLSLSAGGNMFFFSNVFASNSLTLSTPGGGMETMGGSIVAAPNMSLSGYAVGNPVTRFNTAADNLVVNTFNSSYILESDSVLLGSSSANGIVDFTAGGDISIVGNIYGGYAVTLVTNNLGDINFGANVQSGAVITVISSGAISQSNPGALLQTDTLYIISDSSNIGSLASRINTNVVNLSANALGNAFLNSTGNVALNQSSANSFSLTSAGDVTANGPINAHDLYLQSSADIDVNTDLISTNSANGDGGNITIDATGNIHFAPGTVSVAGSGNGNGGNIVIRGDHISTGTGGVGGGLVIVNADGAGTGNGGTLSIEATASDADLHVGNLDFIVIARGGTTSGNGGSITMSAGRDLILHGLDFAVRPQGADGYGGNLTFSAGNTFGSAVPISVNGAGNGNGGNVTITANHAGFPDISANGVGTGNGGNINITTQSGGIEVGGDISATGLNGGQINIATTGTLLFSGATDMNVGSSDNTFTHPIGDINITARDINVTGGALNVYAYNPLALSNTGNVHITTTTGNLVTNGNYFLITAYGGIDINLAGGTLDTTGVAPGEVRLLGHTTTDLHGATINASATGGNNGGQAVFVQGGYVFLGDVIANGTGAGNGGALLLNAFAANVGNIILDGGISGNGGYMDLQSYGAIDALSFSAQGGINGGNGGTLGLANHGGLGTRVTGSLNVSGGNNGGNLYFSSGTGGITTGDLLATGGAHGGNIVANTSGDMNFLNIDASATIDGDGGTVTLNTTGTGNINFTAGTVSVNGSGSGNGGDLALNTNALNITGGHKFFAADGGATGNGGDVSIVSRSAAADLVVGSLDGHLIAVARGGSTSGNGGNVSLNSGRDLILTGADFSVRPQSTTGDAGNLTFEATNTFAFGNGMQVDASGGNLSGNGGNITVNADIVSAGSHFYSFANGGGTAGTISVTGNTVSQLFADARSGNGANGGTVILTVGAGGLLGGMDIRTGGTPGFNNGTISIFADSLNLNTPVYLENGGGDLGTGSVTITTSGNLTSTAMFSVNSHNDVNLNIGGGTMTVGHNSSISAGGVGNFNAAGVNFVGTGNLNLSAGFLGAMTVGDINIGTGRVTLSTGTGPASIGNITAIGHGTTNVVVYARSADALTVGSGGNILSINADTDSHGTGGNIEIWNNGNGTSNGGVAVASGAISSAGTDGPDGQIRIYAYDEIGVPSTYGNVTVNGDSTRGIFNASGSNVNISITGDLTTGAISALNGSVNATASGSLHATNSIDSTNGSVLLIANAGSLNVDGNVAISATEGNILLQNTDTAGTISIGSDTTISASTAGNTTGIVHVIIGGIPGSPTNGTAANVVQNELNGGQVYLGDDVIALPPDNIITADGGSVIFSTDGTAGSISLGGGVLINSTTAPTVQVLLTSLDLTDPTVVALIQSLQSQGYIGGTLLSDMSGVAIGGNAIIDPTDLANLLTAENIPANVTLSFDSFTNSNPLNIALTGASTTSQVLISGTHEYINSSFGHLDIDTTLGGDAFVITNSGLLNIASSLFLNSEGNVILGGNTNANDVTIWTTNNANIDVAGNVTASSFITFEPSGGISQSNPAGQLLVASGGVITLVSQPGGVGSGDIGSASQRVRIGSTSGSFIFGGHTQGNVFVESANSFAFGTGNAGAGPTNTFDVRTAAGSNGSITLQGVQSAGTIILSADGGGSITNNGSFQDANTLVLVTGGGNIGTDTSNIFTNARNLQATTTQVAGFNGVYITDNNNDGVTLFGQNIAGHNGAIFFLNATGSTGNITTAPGGSVLGGLTVLHTDNGNIGEMPSAGDWSAALLADGPGTSRTMSAPNGNVYLYSLNSTNFVDGTINGVTYANTAQGDFFAKDLSHMTDGFFWGGGTITGNNVLLQSGGNITQVLYGGGALPVNLVGPDQTLTISANGTAIIAVQSGVNVISQLGINNTAAGDFELTSAGTINVNAPISASNVSLTTANNGDINLRADINATAAATLTADGTGNIQTLSQLTATIPVGGTPQGGAISPNGTFSYVTGLTSDNVTVIDTATNSVIATIAVGSQPEGVTFNHDGTLAYTVNQGSGDVTIIDTTTHTVVGTISGMGGNPHAMAISPDNSYAYVTVYFNNEVKIVDLNTNQVVGSIGVGAQPLNVQFSPDGSRAYVVNEGSSNISVINTATNSVITTVAVGGAPQGVSVSPTGRYIYVANMNSNNVSVIDAKTNNVINTIAVGATPQAVSFNANGTLAYVLNLDGNTTSIIDTATQQVIDTVAAGTRPVTYSQFVGLVGVNTTALAPNSASNTATVIRMPSINASAVSLTSGTGDILVQTSTQSLTANTAGNVSIGNVGNVTLNQASGSSFSLGALGDITVNGPVAAHDMSFQANGSNSNISFNTALTTVNALNGDGGSITIDATGAISFGGFQFVTAAGTGNGNGGTIKVKGDSISIVGGGHGSFNADGSGTGNGGLVDLETTSATADIYIGTNPGFYSVVARGGTTSGNGGTVTLTSARDLYLTGDDVAVRPQGADGYGGNMNFTAGRTFGGAVPISVNGAGNGDGGNINVTAFEVGLGASANGAGTGNGGNIIVTTTGGYYQTAGTTSATGMNGGYINVNAAGPLLFVGATNFDASSTASSNAYSNGDIWLWGSEVNANGALTFNSSNPLAQANTGSIELDAMAGNIVTNGNSITVTASDYVRLRAQGNLIDLSGAQGGSLYVVAGGLITAVDATINTSSTAGNNSGGTVNWIANGFIEAQGGIISDGSGTGSGGNISLTGGGNFYAIGPISANGGASGDGGSVSISLSTTNEAVIESISAVGGSGVGGSVNINASRMISLNGDVVATGSISVITQNGFIDVWDGVSITATEGNILLQSVSTDYNVALEGDNIITASTTGTTLGKVFIAVGGIPGVPVEGTSANVVQNELNGGQIYLGDDVSAFPPANVITANGGQVVFSTDGGVNANIYMGGNVQINALAAPSGQTLLTSLDLTDPTVVALIQSLQTQGFIGGSLISNGSGIAIGGNAIIDPNDIASLLTAEYIPASVTLTFDNFSNANVVQIGLTASSSTTQVRVYGTHEYINSSYGFLDIDSTLGGTALLISGAGQINNVGSTLVVNAEAGMTLSGITNGNAHASDITFATTNNGAIAIGGDIAGTSSVTLSAGGSGAITRSNGLVSAPSITLQSGTGNIGTQSNRIQVKAGTTLVASTGGTSANAYLTQLHNASGSFTLQNSSAGSTSGNFDIESQDDIIVQGGLSADRIILETNANNSDITLGATANVNAATRIDLQNHGTGEAFTIAGSVLTAGNTVFSTGNTTLGGIINANGPIDINADGTLTVNGTINALSSNQIHLDTTVSSLGAIVFNTGSVINGTTGLISSVGGPMTFNGVINMSGNGNVHLETRNASSGAINIGSTSNIVMAGGNIDIFSDSNLNIAGDMSATGNGHIALTTKLGSNGVVTTTSDSVLSAVNGNVDVLSAGNITIDGVITMSGNGLLALTARSGSNKSIAVNNNIGGSLSAVNVKADGTGSITSTGGVITGTTVDLDTGTGNIGTAALAIHTNANFLDLDTQGTTAGTGELSVIESNDVTINNSRSGRNFSVTALGSLTVSDVTALNGSIQLATGTVGANSSLTIKNAAVLSATEGNITLWNKDTTTGTIAIGKNAKITALTASPVKTLGKIDVVIASTIPVVPVLGSAPANVTVTNTAPGQVYFGTNGITAVGPVNKLNAKRQNIVFSTGNRPASAISLGGGVVMTADPPLADGAVDIVERYSTAVPTRSLTTASATVLDTQNENTMTTMAVSQNTLDLPVANATAANQNTALSEIERAAAKYAAQAINSDKVTFAGTTDGEEFSMEVEASVPFADEIGLTEQGTTSESGQVATNSNASEQVGSSNLVDMNTYAAKKSTGVSRDLKLSLGNMLVAPTSDTSVKTPWGSIEVAANAVVLVMASENSIAAFDLHDAHKGSVKLIAGNETIVLSPGTHATITRGAQHFEEVNNAEAILHKGMSRHKLNNGHHAFRSEFSIISAIDSVKPLKSLVSTKNKQANRVTERIMKTAAVVMQISNSSTDYQQYPRPRMTASK